MEGYGEVVQEFMNESLVTLPLTTFSSTSCPSSSLPSSNTSSNPSSSSISNLPSFDPSLLVTLSARQHIHEQLSQGHILEGLSLIEQSFPNILHDPLLLFQLYEQHFIESILNSDLMHALQFASEKILPLIISESKLRPKMEEMMCLILFLNSQQESSIPSQYLSKFHFEKRYELARTINVLILQTYGNYKEAKFVKVLKEMLCQQNVLKRKANVAFPQPEIEL